jgi:hypothetical protein
VKVRTATRRGADPREALAAVENKTMDQADQVLAEMVPEVTKVEQKWVGKTMTQLLLAFRNETVAKLEQIRDFRSHIQHDASIADVIEHLTHQFFAEAKRSVIIERAGHCEFVDEVTGRRCTSTYQLQEDHIIPLALVVRIGRKTCAAFAGNTIYSKLNESWVTAIQSSNPSLKRLA